MASPLFCAERRRSEPRLAARGWRPFSANVASHTGSCWSEALVPMAPAATTRRSSPVRAVRHGAGWLSETTGWLDVEHGACIAAAVSRHGEGSSGGALQRRLHGFSAGWRLAVLLLLACGACGLSSRRSSCCAEVFAAGWVAWLAQSRAGLNFVTW